METCQGRSFLNLESSEDFESVLADRDVVIESGLREGRGQILD